MNKLIKNLLVVCLLSFSAFSVDVKSTTTVTDPQGNVTTTVYFGPYISESTTYKGSSSLLSTTTYCYNGDPYPCIPSAVALPVSQKDVFIAIPGISGPSRTETMYSTYGLPTDIKAFDYGLFLVSEMTTEYCTLSNDNIRNLPCTVTSKDSGGTTVAKGTFEYDPTGNLLKRHTLVGGSTYLTEMFTYAPNGIKTSYTAVNGSTTAYTNGTCNGMKATSISHPVTGTQTFTWNCDGAVPTATTDVNGSAYAISYADPFWRPTSGTDPLGTLTNITYTPTSYESVMAFSNSVNDSLTTLDVYGRPHVSQIRQSKGAATFDTTSHAYDSMGRIAYSSLPCEQSAGTPCPSTQLAVTYDKGSVPTTTLTDSNGGILSVAYAAGDVTTLVSPASSGEGVKGRQMEYDGLGRLTSVCEISNGPGSGSCGQRIAQTGYVTTYAYDSMGQVTAVTQGTQTRASTYDDVGRALTSTQPETGTITYTYDTTTDCGGITSNGNLVEMVDNAGNTTCYGYDAAARLTSVTHSGPNPTDDAYFVYDAATVGGQTMVNAKGRLAEAYTCTSCPETKKTDVGFSYDIIGQATDVYQSTPNSGGYYHVALTVYPNQSIHTLQMTPSVIPTITYSLDGEGRISMVGASSGQSPLVFTTARGPANQISSIIYGSSDVDTFGYDSLLRMTAYSFQAGSTTVIGQLSYNPNGTLGSSQVVDPFSPSNNQTCAYSYDPLVRLSTSNCGSINQSFSYDQYGNITKTGTFSFTPTYSATTNRMTAIGAVTPTYDANGNILTDGTSTYTWDSEGRMLSGPGVDSIVYNALGQMAEQTRGSTHQQIVYFPSGEKLALMNGQSLNLARVPLPGGAQAVYTSAGLQYYAHVDGSMGSVRMTTTPARSVSSDLAYAPFGEPYNNIGVPTSALSFTGHNQDTVTGLYDTPTREYNPLQGRWISSDKNASPSIGNPQSFNLYAYAANNPLLFTDSSGAILDDPSGDEPVYGPGLGGTIQDPASYDPNRALENESPTVFNADPNLYSADVAIDPLGQAVLSDPIFANASGAIDTLLDVELGGAALGLGSAAVASTGVATATSGIMTAANTWWLTTGLPMAVTVGCAELCNSLGDVAPGTAIYFAEGGTGKGVARLFSDKRFADILSKAADNLNAPTRIGIPFRQAINMSHVVEEMRQTALNFGPDSAIGQDAVNILNRWNLDTDIWKSIEEVNSSRINHLLDVRALQERQFGTQDIFNKWIKPETWGLTRWQQNYPSYKIPE